MGTAANRRNKLETKNLNLKIKVCDDTIEESISEKLLGLIINNTLTWKHYFYGNDENSGLLKELSKRIGILKKIRIYMPDNKIKIIVNGIFNSKMIYCMTVWGGIWGLQTQKNCERRNMGITKEEMRNMILFLASKICTKPFWIYLLSFFVSFLNILF